MSRDPPLLDAPMGERASLSSPPATHSERSDDTSVAPPAIDRKAWDSIRAFQRPGQPDMLAKYLGMYAQSSRELVDALRGAVRDGDAQALHRTAHTLKSSSAMLGARHLAVLCSQGEEMGRSGHLERAARLMGEIDAEYARVQRAITAELNGEQA